MPLYSYKCEDNHITEILCKYSELQGSIPCEKCNKDSIKIIEANKQSFTLIGPGYYKTTYPKTR